MNNNNIIENVFKRKDEIIKRTKEYQQSDVSDYAVIRRNMYEYFDKNYNNDEIMVIQSIMYFGRECYSGFGDNYDGNVYKVINDWMKNLFFSFGKDINKEIEIDQMIGKQSKIGTYFEYGFKELENRGVYRI